MIVKNAGRLPKSGQYFFRPNSFCPELIFPNVSYEYILSIQFELAYGFKCSPFDFDEVELFDFLTMWDKLAQRKEREAKENDEFLHNNEHLGLTEK